MDLFEVIEDTFDGCDKPLVHLLVIIDLYFDWPLMVATFDDTLIYVTLEELDQYHCKKTQGRF